MIFNQLFLSSIFFLSSISFSASLSHHDMEKRSNHLGQLVRRQQGVGGGIGATPLGPVGEDTIPADAAVVMSVSSSINPLSPGPSSGIGAVPINNPGDQVINADGNLVNSTGLNAVSLTSSAATTTTVTTTTTSKTTTTTSAKVTTAASLTTSASSGSTTLVCTVEASSKAIEQATQEYLQQGFETCGDAVKESGIAEDADTALTMCYRVGYIDDSTNQFGAELTVWGVGSTINQTALSAISLGLKYGSNSLFTQTNSLSISNIENFKGSASDIDISSPSYSTTVSGKQLELVGSFHFATAIPANVTGYESLVPEVELFGLQSSSPIKVLGMLDVTTKDQIENEAWGLYKKTISGTSSSTRMIRRLKRGDVGKFPDKALVTTTSSTSTSSAATTSASSQASISSSNLQPGDTIIFGDNVCTVSAAGTSTTTTTTTTTTETKTTTTEAKTTTTETTTTTKAKATTTTTTKAAATTTTTTEVTTTTTTTSTTTTASTSATGIGANVIGFGSSIQGSSSTTSTTIASATASAGGIAVVGVTGTSSSATSTTSSVSNPTVADDTAPSASTSAFQLPGRQLQVLPIGLGVFGGISLIALVIVVVVTYERRKYRKQFRARKMQEQISTAAGYGSTNNGMSEIRL